VFFLFKIAVQSVQYRTLNASEHATVCVVYLFIARTSAAAEIVRVGGHYAVQRHSRSLNVFTNQNPECNLLSVINTNLSDLATVSSYRSLAVKLSRE